jgi:hypothetical protein
VEAALGQQVDGRSVYLNHELPPNDPLPQEKATDLAPGDPPHGVPHQRPEHDNAVQPVEELGAEEPLSHFHVSPLAPHGSRLGAFAGSEAQRRGVLSVRAQVGGHDEDGAAEVGCPTSGIRQPAFPSDCEQGVECRRVRFLDLIQEHYAEGLLLDPPREFTLRLLAPSGSGKALDSIASAVLAHVQPD